MSGWNDQGLMDLFLARTPLIDVRAPVEFGEGSIPYSINLPILNDEERKLVGTCYKVKGQAAALNLGHELVSGSLKQQRISNWQNFLSQHPSAGLFCFRGGLRSQLACQWLREEGREIFPLSGGYKRLRQFFLSWLNEAPLPKIYRLGGYTGSGKTQLLQQLPQGIDLEQMANHKGSTFGDQGVQPAQISFENQLALRLLHLARATGLVVEDESLGIGKITIPRRFFLAMRSSPLVILQASLEERVNNIFTEYVATGDQQFFLAGLMKIKLRLSGPVYREIEDEMQKAFQSAPKLSDHAPWISLLLEHYYDPLYRKDIDRQKPLIVLKGEASTVREFLMGQERGGHL